MSYRFVEFDGERDCSEPNVVQDVCVSLVNGTLCIEQPDGVGDIYHFIAMPPHMLTGFVEALGAVISGADPITISGVPTTEE